MFPQLDQDFTDMLTALRDNNVEYIIVGGFAMAFNGYVRATGDIDILVKPDPGNAVKIMSALQQFGAPLAQVTASDFEKEGTIFQIGVPPVRIDIITKIDGVDFNECTETKKIMSRNGIDVPYISLEILIKNKKAAGREKDLIDLMELEKRRLS